MQAEQVARAAAVSTLQRSVDAENTARTFEDRALRSTMTANVYSLQSTVNRGSPDVTTRVSTLEARLATATASLSTQVGPHMSSECTLSFIPVRYCLSTCIMHLRMCMYEPLLIPCLSGIVFVSVCLSVCLFFMPVCWTGLDTGHQGADAAPHVVRLLFEPRRFVLFH